LLEQLINDETPRIVVDIGANDGICGSNSRKLLEQGWQGLLVEPLPSLFGELKKNSTGLPDVMLAQCACSDRNGTASLRIGKDGELGQMSSLSSDPIISENLAEATTDVESLTLGDLLARYQIPNDFGVLLIDTEGWDLQVLRGLKNTSHRPRIIVTEDFGSTDETKYSLLRLHGYRLAGTCATDSFWVSEHEQNVPSTLEFPVSELPADWRASGEYLGPGGMMLDVGASFQSTIVGWAFWKEAEPPPDAVVLLRETGSQACRAFRAWRTPRKDVVGVFQSENLLMSGFRAHVNVPPGNYYVSVVQPVPDGFVEACAGPVRLPRP
jgi:FkbM family methyltransferase